MDKKPLSERVRKLLKHGIGSPVIDRSTLESWADEIADLERRLELIKAGKDDWESIATDNTAAAYEYLSDLRELWLDAVAEWDSSHKDMCFYLKENEQLRAQLAERDTLLEEQKLRIEALMIGVEEHTGKQGTTPVLTYIAGLEAEIKKYKTLFHEHYKGPL